MITLEILDYHRNFVKVKTYDDNAIKEIPQKGDTLVLHFKEEKTNVTVLRREFDEEKQDVIRIVTNFMKYNPRDVDETMLP